MRFLAIFLVLLSLACGEKRQETTERASQGPVRVTNAERRPALLEVAGTIRAGDMAELASRFGGYVRQVAVHAGSTVRRGDLLILLDEGSLKAQESKTIGAEVEVREAIEETRQHVRAAEAQKELASNTFERIRTLYEKKSASRQEYEEAYSRKESADALWEAANRKMAQASSRLQQVRSDRNDVSASLSYQRITAPFDGIVTSVPADTGTFVNPGQIVVVLENPKAFHFHFAVEPALIPALSQSVKVVIPAVSSEALDAKILEVSPAADSITRTFRVKALLADNPALRTGLTGTIRLQSQSESTWIPEDFLTTRNELETVMVHQQNQWRRVLVKSGSRLNGEVEILSGLSGGEQIGLFSEE